VTEVVGVRKSRDRRGSRGAVLLLAGVFVAGTLLVGCMASSGAVMGSCVIRGGTMCEGNYMPRAALHSADLFGADLRRADLTRAQLGDADLAGADLDHAKLHGAHLDGSDLVMANLSDADLTRATLARANLTYANLYGARTVGNELRGAKLCVTTLPDGLVANPTCADPLGRVMPMPGPGLTP
jgi:uncharacterized protein YjbI with pentapeptide repeats